MGRCCPDARMDPDPQLRSLKEGGSLKNRLSDAEADPLYR